MNNDLPPEVDAIRRRLVTAWIDGRDTVDGQVDGCVLVAATFAGVLRALIGEIGTRAVLRRAAALAARRFPALEGLDVTPAGLDSARLQALVQGESAARTREMLAALVNELFAVLYGLLRRALLPVLREVEAELAGEKSAPDAGEEKR